MGDADGPITATGTQPNLAASSNHNEGVITTPALTTAAGSTFTITLTNPNVYAVSIVQVEVYGGGTNTNLGTFVNEVTPSAGSVAINIKNGSASALNGTVKVAFSIN